MKTDRFFYYILLLLLTSTILLAKDIKPYWIFINPQYIENNSENLIQYKDDTYQRLQQNKWQRDYSDFRPSKELESTIEKSVRKIRYYSRSLCAFSVEVDSNKLDKLQSFPFIKKIRPVGIRKKSRVDLGHETVPNSLAKSNDFYGNSLSQLEQLNVLKVHEMGLTGKDVRVAVIDAGFRKDHQSFEYLLEQNRLINEYDFIHHDSNVQDEAPEDTVGGSRQQSHGTAVLSCIVGYVPNNIIGSAYNAEILLAKTEVSGSETRIEEDNYVAAVEWADENGAHIISSSLGYRDFDNFDYEFTDLDGETAVTTQAANWAFRRGILLVTAAGNDAYHFSDGGLITPGDAWGALTVGAVDKTGERASFSSYGPTADGRIKPEICARGYRAYVASDYKIDGYRYSNGTSFSTPLMAGCCALILEKYPTWTPAMVIDNLKKFSDRSDNPDRQYGWGIPDVFRLITETTDTTAVTTQLNKDLVIAPNPAQIEAKIYFKWVLSTIDTDKIYDLNIYNLYGEPVFTIQLNGKNIGTIDLIEWNLKNKIGKKVSSGIYFVNIRGKNLNKTKKFTVLK